MRVDLWLLATLVACGPAHVLTRPEGNGGWSAGRRGEELDGLAHTAKVDLQAAPVPTDDADTPMTLARAVDLATRENLRVAEADRSVDIARERVMDARGRLLPTIVGQGRTTWYTDPQVTNVHLPPGLLPSGVPAPVVVVREQHFTTVNGTASVPIDLFGQLVKGLTAEQAGYRAEEARRFATLLDQQVATVRAYFAVLEAARLRAVTEQTLAAQRQQLANAERKFVAGRLTKNELLVVQVAVRDTEQILRRRTLDIDRARWALNELIGRPVDAPTRVVDVRDAPLVPAAADALREAYAHNPVLQSLVEEQQRLEDTAEAISRSRLPQFQGGGAVDDTTSEVLQPQRVGSAFLGFSWELDGGRKTAQTAEARLAAEQNRTRIERSLREVEATVRATQGIVEERLAALATAETAVSQAEENLRIRTEQFDVGRATSTDVLDAQALLAAQRADLATALYDAHARRAELQQVMGLPLDAILPDQR